MGSCVVILASMAATAVKNITEVKYYNVKSAIINTELNPLESFASVQKLQHNRPFTETKGHFIIIKETHFQVAADCNFHFTKLIINYFKSVPDFYFTLANAR